MWRGKFFHIRNAIECVVSCRTNACGATMLFGHANRIGATKGAMKYNIFFKMNIEIFFKKG
jgi:hypothetical protein